MKWTLLLAFTLAIAAGCKKDTVATEEGITTHTTADGSVKNTLVGTWSAFEFYQDQGDGSGKWIAIAQPESVTFTASGEVSFSGNSPLANRGFNRYKILDGNHVELYSTTPDTGSEIYYYNRETDTHLLFNPQCRENCSRRYKLVN